MGGTALQARWGETGTWQTFVIENVGGGAIVSGDVVFLKAHTGMMVDVEGAAVQARWNDKGDWQKLIIEKKDGSGGAILPGDAILLQGHTGKMIDVEGPVVQARFSERGDWQTLVIERAVGRRLVGTSVKTGSPEVPRSMPPGVLAVVMAVVACLTMVLALAWRKRSAMYIKVEAEDHVDMSLP